MNLKVLATGFFLFLLSTFGTNIVMARYNANLMTVFGWAGLYAGLLASSSVGFFVLIVFFFVAHKLHIDADIPEVG